MTDPAVAYKCSTLAAAWALLANKWGQTPIFFSAQFPGGNSLRRILESDPIYLPENVEDALEELALARGMRSRRILLDADWSKQAAVPMLARVADRRSQARPDDPAASSPEGTGWVALVPRATGGYRMVAAYPDLDTIAEWEMDAALAQRLAPFAFTFHERFAARALRPGDIARFALRYGGRDLGLLLLAG